MVCGNLGFWIFKNLQALCDCVKNGSRSQQNRTVTTIGNNIHTRDFNKLHHLFQQPRIEKNLVTIIYFFRKNELFQIKQNNQDTV